VSVWKEDGKIKITEDGKVYVCDDCPCSSVCFGLASSYLVQYLDPVPTVSAQGIVTAVEACANISPPIAPGHGYCASSQVNKCYWVGACTSGTNVPFFHFAVLLRHVSISGANSTWSVEVWDDVFSPANDLVGFTIATGAHPTGTYVRDFNTNFVIS
jgi:hypothetical protein